jgi:enoyl-CoA hydratase/carnithine racemase
VIGAINGACYAGGVELAAWCDFRIVDERATFGLLNKRWGLRWPTAARSACRGSSASATPST